MDFSTNNGVLLNEADEITSFDFGFGLTGSLSVTGGTGQALILNSDGVGTVGVTQDPDLQSPFSDADGVGPGLSFGNVLIIQSNDAGVGTPNDEAGGGSITFNFDNAITLSEMFVLDGEEGISLSFGSTVLTGLGGPDNTYDLVLANSGPITMFTVDFGGSGAIGGFEAAVVPPAVPLPAGLPLMLGGIGAFAWMKRRKRA